MATMQRVGALCGAVASILLAAGTPAPADTVTFVHVNDLDRFQAEDGAGGMARLKAVIDRVRGERDHVVVTHGGDMISPSLLSSIDQGAHMVALNNAIGLDVATLGNHEFDFGPDVLEQRIGEAEYAWVSTNVELDGAPFPGTTATFTLPVGERTIGFLGLTTPETAVLSSPGDDVAFADPVVAATRASAELEAAGADLIVALTHLGLSEDRAVAGVDGIDVVLGGHDHEPTTILLGDTLIHKSGAQAEYVGVIDIELAADPDAPWRPSWRVVATAAVEPDPEVQALVEQYAGRLDDELGQPIGTTAVALDTRRLSVRTGETNFGNLVADVMRAATGADVALTNGGGIRGDRLYEPGTRLTRGDILSELPFGNKTVLLEVTGADIRTALENGVSQIEDRAGRFPQVSGMTVRYDPGAAPGERLVEVRVGGAPLDPDATYTLATNDYVAGGGDGYAVLENATTLIDAYAAELMATQVIAFIEAEGSIAPEREGRIVEASS